MTSGNCSCTERQHAITVGNHDINVSKEERNLYSANEIPEYINRTIWLVVAIPWNLHLAAAASKQLRIRMSRVLMRDNFLVTMHVASTFYEDLTFP